MSGDEGAKMKRHLWNLTMRIGTDTISMDNTDVGSLAQEGIQRGANVIILIRGRDCSGKLPTVEDVQKIYKGHRKSNATAKAT